jgi:hypothetical protein
MDLILHLDKYHILSPYDLIVYFRFDVNQTFQ